MLTNRRNGALYTGVTANLPARIHQHRDRTGSDFVRRYGLSRLVWYEMHEEMFTAIAREKQIKEWKRAWKIELIESFNPDWADLWETLNQ
jgi:putative endonuclease